MHCIPGSCIVPSSPFSYAVLAGCLGSSATEMEGDDRESRTRVILEVAGGPGT